MDMEDELKKLADRLNSGGTGGNTLAPQYPQVCRCCGTEHIPNRNPYYHENCQRNEKLREFLKRRNEWLEENTAQIWAQSDKEPGEDDES